MRASRLKEVFLAVASVPVQDRCAVLDRECGSDTTLRRDVEELLSRDGVSTDLTARLSSGLGDLPAWAPEAPPPPPVVPGSTLGPYRVVRVLGSGGASCVYEAVREGLDRPVAVKVLHALVETPHARWRFEHEVRSLSRLSHPAIVRVVDFGVDQSRAYLVMDLIGGPPVPLAEAARGMDLRDLLTLFRTVCEAVAHAHTRGVIHRDLKSANVLVARDAAGNPVPALVDFGIARTFGATPDAQETVRYTHPGLVVGTLGTLSPEQASAQPDAVDTRTDVWGLGVLLFEALTGVLPHGRPGPGPAATADWLARVQEEEPPRAGSLRPTIPPDLDAITARCLALRKEDRYASAEALAEDVGRFLAGRPTLARPPGLLEVWSRWARRHWKLAGSVGLAAGLVLAAVLSAAWAREAEYESLRRSVRENRYLLEDVVSLADERPGTREFRERLLDRVQPQLARDLLARPDDDEARRVMAMLLRRRGELCMETSRYALARNCFETSLDMVRQLHDRTGEPDIREVAASMVRLGDAYSQLNNPPERTRWYTMAHHVLEEAARAEPARTDLPNDLCWSLERLAAHNVNAAERAETRARRLAIARELLEREPNSVPALHNLVDALHQVESTNPGSPQRLELATEACRLGDMLLASRPQSRLYRRLVALCKADLVVALLQRKKIDEALRESAALWDQTLAAVREDNLDQFALETLLHSGSARGAALEIIGDRRQQRIVFERGIAELTPGAEAGVGGYVVGARILFRMWLAALDDPEP